MKSRTHTLQTTVVKYGVTDLFTPLREHAAEPAVKRVENVLSLLVAADTLAREQREKVKLYERSGKDWRREDGKSFRESQDASNRTWRMLNAALRPYPTLPLAQGGIGRFEIIDRPVTSSSGHRAPWERWAVGALLNLAKKPGGLSLLRRCSECSHWFYANRPWQQFCGVACQRRHTAQDPEFKEKRARYMREIYRPIIEPREDARAKQQAGWVLSEKSKKGGK
jgi:hypothetical protein